MRPNISQLTILLFISRRIFSFEDQINILKPAIDALGSLTRLARVTNVDLRF